MGDFNAHHTSWGCYYCDGFAPLLIDIFEDTNLCILNDGTPTRRVYPYQNPKSAIDLSLSSPSLASQLSWKVLPSTFGSDHFPIILSLNTRSLPPSNPSPLLKYKLHKADWSRYAQSPTLIFLVKSLMPKITYLPPPWWDGECTDLFNQRKAAEEEYTDSMTNDNFMKYQHLDAKIKRLVSKKKRFGWTKFCESLGPRSPSTVVWTNMRRFRRSLNHTDPSSNNPSEWLNFFTDKLAPPYVPHMDDFPIYTPVSTADEMDAPFSFSELEIALTGLKDSAPGEDGVPYSFLAKLKDKSKLYFLNLINSFFESGIVPNSWKTQLVIPLLKPGKNPSEPNSYRPIALSSTLAKVSEILLKNRLEWVMESRGVLSPSQFGFRKGFSTADSLSILTTDIRTAFGRGEYLVGIFLDIASAYDNVLLPLLRQKLHQLSVPPRITHFICNLLCGRSVVVKQQSSYLSPRLVWKGLPQGSVLSPLLYSIYTHDLELSVNNFCNILQYADDIVLYHSSGSVEEISQCLNSALYYLGQWLSDHGLSLSVAKCQAVVFTRKRSHPTFNFCYEDQPINLVDKAKFLGIILDSRLNGLPHTEYVIKKCEKGINVLRAVAGVWWGAHAYSLKLLYNALVRSHVDYCSYVLDPLNKTTSEMLNRTQYRSLRIILGAMKSSPTNALQVECVDPPLHLRRQYLCDRYV
ncbi:jg18039, partial [Pararge aegeria aegeria]